MYRFGDYTALYPFLYEKNASWAPKFFFLSKVDKLAGKIGIDLKLINCINDFFCAILSFWDMIDFVFFPLGLSRNLKKRQI